MSTLTICSSLCLCDSIEQQQKRLGNPKPFFNYLKRVSDKLERVVRLHAD